jgi:hypothetical protein
LQSLDGPIESKPSGQPPDWLQYSPPISPQLGAQSPHQMPSPQLSVCQPQLPGGQPEDWQAAVLQHGSQS